jgi:hypothetical protein
MKTYKTASGSYNEDELAIVVWRNPDSRKSSQARFLETMTSEDSEFPMAFPIKSLTSKKEWALAARASSMQSVVDYIPTSTRTEPMIIPLPIARETFGWDTFYVPSEFTT